MLRVFSKKTDIGIHEPIELESLIENLSELGYEPVIRSMINRSYSTAKLLKPNKWKLVNILEQEEGLRRRDYPGSPTGSDLFFKDDLLFVMFPEYEHTIVSLIGYEQEVSNLDQFCIDYQKSVEKSFDKRRIRNKKFEWKETSFMVENFDYGINYEYPFLYNPQIPDDKKFEEPTYTEDEVKSIDVLCDTKLRLFLIKVSKYGKISQKNAEHELKDPNQIQQLIEHELIAKEYLIKCKQDQRPICTVPSKEKLDENSSEGTKCGNCSKPLKEEIIEEVFTITSKGRNLIRGSRWMSIWVTEQLIQHGIKPNRIEWNLEENDEEIDIRISDFHSKALLELKDREFGGGDMHPFLYRVEKYGGDFGAILTTQKISSDARTILKEQKRKIQFQINTLEGMTGIPTGITNFVEEMSLAPIQRHLRSIQSLHGMIIPMVKEWAKRKISNHPPLEIESKFYQTESMKELQNKPSLEN